MNSEKKIVLENRIVCFIDILGFADIIERFEETKDISVIEKIKFAFDESINQIQNPISSKSAEILNVSEEKINLLKKDIFFKTFSDNIIISFTYDNNNFLSRLQLILTFSNIFQYSMTSQGVYTRGGISYGSFYSDDNIIFSNALVKAYILESKTALYPRIVIDKKIIDAIKNCNDETLISSGLSELIYFDWENIAFLNPFNFADRYAKEMEELFNSEEFLNSEELKERLEKMTESTKNIFLKPYSSLLKVYSNIINEVKIKSTDLHTSEHIRNKYVWLIEFYKWKYLNEHTMLNFKMLADILDCNN